MAASELVSQLSRSQIYLDYERAFQVATKLPLTLRPPKSWSLVQKGLRNENPFCAMLGESNATCAACLEMQDKITGSDATEAVSGTCFAGLCDTAVPVRIGAKLVGFLQTGQVALQAPTAARFGQITKKIAEWGLEVDLKRLEDAYFHSHVLTPEQYAGAVRLLEIFSRHLGLVGSQILIEDATAESPFSRRAKAFVDEHQEEAISLEEAAKALHVSTFYFCKMFKKATGLTFTDYLARVRVEKAKKLLLDPHLRVTEVAFQVGFGSLTHFNRVFRKLVGQSPTDFRAKVAGSL